MMTTNLQSTLDQLGIGHDRFTRLLNLQLGSVANRYTRLWSYYANPMRPTAPESLADRPYRQAQEWGMPARITRRYAGVDPLTDGAIPAEAGLQRKEVVVENDIAWRIDTMVEYLFGKLPLIQSTHADPARRQQIDTLLAAILDHNGGTQLLQQMALLGAVYGFVDIAVTLKTDRLADGDTISADTGNPSPDAANNSRRLLQLARLVSLKIVPPARALALLDPTDADVLLAYAQVQDVPSPATSGGLVQSFLNRVSSSTGGTTQLVELWTADGWWRWRGEALEASGGNSLARLPMVHIQNTAMPFAYSGASDVEPLIPLQDELNTRLSDRAYRIAMQSFKMYLGINIGDFDTHPPMPGRYWSATDPAAEIKEIGGTASCPSEDTHIAEVREALDRASGVPPVAAGAIRNRIGNLTSAAALRITLMSLLARTERKRALYGEGLERLCELALAWLNAAGVFPTTPDERAVTLRWPSPLPENDIEKLDEAKLKLDLGLPKETVLHELGY